MIRCVGAVALLALVALAARVLLVLFAGFLFAVALRGAARFIAVHARIRYGIALALLVLVLLGATTTGIIVHAPRVASEVAKLPELLSGPVERTLASLHLPVMQKGSQGGTGRLRIDEIFSGAIGTASATLEILAGLVVIFFVGVYGAANPRLYSSALSGIFSGQRRVNVNQVLGNVAGQLEHWLLGRLVAMLFVGVTTAIAFSLLDLPLAVALATVCGVLTFVEYLGAVVSAVPAILLGLTRGVAVAAWVGVIFVALHVVEGYVLTPMLGKSTVRIPPAYGLASQVILTALVGPLGLTFSTPLLVVAGVLYGELRHASSEVTPP